MKKLISMVVSMVVRISKGIWWGISFIMGVIGAVSIITGLICATIFVIVLAIAAAVLFGSFVGALILITGFLLLILLAIFCAFTIISFIEDDIPLAWEKVKAKISRVYKWCN